MMSVRRLFAAKSGFRCGYGRPNFDEVKFPRRSEPVVKRRSNPAQAHRLGRAERLSEWAFAFFVDLEPHEFFRCKFEIRYLPPVYSNLMIHE